MIQEAKEYAVYLLIERGYDGEALQAVVKGMLEAHAIKTITKKHSHKQIRLLACANMHGKIFLQMGQSCLL